MEDIILKHINTDVTHGRGCIYSLQYHIVWCTKYRKQVLVDGLDEELKHYLLLLAKNIGMSIDAMEVMPDHVHLLVSCNPQCRLSDVIRIIKGNTARWLFLLHPELKQKLWGGHMWNPSYFVVTVSDRSVEQVRLYIKNQKTQ